MSRLRFLPRPPGVRPITSLSVLTLTALYVGLWAAFAPRSFYDAFPGFHRVWVGVDGPYNEHLVRDVGALYLALAVAGVVGLLLRDASSALLLGGAWTIFGLAHLSYHLHHLSGFGTVDVVGNVVALGGTGLLALHLLVHGLQGVRDS